MIERENPARPHEIVGAVAVGDVNRAVTLADDAFLAWAALPVTERARRLLEAAERLRPHLPELAVLLARETGKVLGDCHGELGFAVTFLRWVAERAPVVLADAETADGVGRMLLQRKPFGVVAAITPWNAPVILAMLKIAPALAAGNTVVVKPSPLAPLTIDRVIAILSADAASPGGMPAGAAWPGGMPADGASPSGTRAGAAWPGGLPASAAPSSGMPPGGAPSGGWLAGAGSSSGLPVVGGLPVWVVHGGAEAAVALAGHSRVRKVAFTGGQAAARAISAAAAGPVTPTVMELGGNDPAILLPDADLSPEAMQRLVMASFATSGQVCMAAKRLYVPTSLRGRFLDSYVDAAGTVLRTGDPLTEGVSMGPLISRAAADRARALIAGHPAIPLGTVDPDLDGYFVAPTLVVDPPPDAKIVAEEQFCPAVPVVWYDSLDAVLAAANAGELGLGASVWSADEERAFAVARRLEAGFVFINTHNRTGLALRAPFGGVKRSGHGREYGDEGILEYAQTCVINAPAAFRRGGAGMAANAYPAGVESA